MAQRTAGLPECEHAKAYAIERLEQDLSPTLLYHSLWHTRDEVAERAQWLAVHEGQSQQAQILIVTAAYYHDIGFIRQVQGHEQASADIASKILPYFGYSQAQVRIIADIILATRIPQSASDPLQQIVADADLDVLGRVDFFERNEALRAELAALGSVTPDEVWYPAQVKFLQQHHYFTATARRQRWAQKQDNLLEMRRLAIDHCPRQRETAIASPAPNFAPP